MTPFSDQAAASNSRIVNPMVWRNRAGVDANGYLLRASDGFEMILNQPRGRSEPTVETDHEGGQGPKSGERRAESGSGRPEVGIGSRDH